MSEQMAVSSIFYVGYIRKLVIYTQTNHCKKSIFKSISTKKIF